jgi:hypothetical protein
MMRAICAVFASLALLAPVQADVDAVTFVTAFRAGTADQYQNKQITGSGISFHGAIKEQIADGTSRTSLVITLGADANGKLNLLKTWEEFVEAERTRTTMVVALSGPALPEPPGRGPTAYEFTGVYDGQVRTIMRAPQAADSYVPDPGPCPGEQPADREKPGRFYCAPLLTGASAKAVGSQ